MKKILLLLISVFFISSSCFGAVVNFAEKDSIDKITEVSMTNNALNNKSLVENVKMLGESTAGVLKTALNGVLVIFLVYIGVSMIISMGTNEDRLSSAKRQFYYALTGLLFLNIPELLFNATTRGKLDEQGNLILDGATGNLTSDIGGFTSTNTTFLGNMDFSKFVGGTIINFMEVVIFGAALFMLIIAGIKVIKSRGKEDDLNEGKFKFSYSIMGLVFVSIMEVYKNVIFNVDVQGGEKIYEQLMGIGAYFLAPLSFFMITLGGYYYLISGGDETKMNKGKNIILYTLFGILVYLASWSILAELNF